MKNLSSDQVFQAINDLEQRFPVHDWRTGDIDLWPIYRCRLYANVMHEVFQNDDRQPESPGLRALLKRGARALLRVPYASLADFAANASIRRGTDALFLSDGMSFVQLDGRWFDRVMDPVIQSLGQRGCGSLKLTPLSEAHVPRFLPSRFVQPALDRMKLMASRRRVAMDLPAFDDCLAQARAMFDWAAPSAQWLAVQASRLAVLSTWFGRWLTRTGARFVFVNTYYSLEGMSLVQAARRAAVKSIDLQHGNQGPHHVAYGRWEAVPGGGYSTLPDEFWVWSNAEAETIDAWRKGRPFHRPRVTGNFWLRRWVTATDPVVANYRARALALRATAPDVRHVLVCLTWGVPESETTKLIEAARACGPGFRWWWRLHPVRARHAGEFARQLEEQGLNGSQVTVATELPLYAVLPAADMLLAHSSTVIQEAEEFGVPAIISSEFGAELHSAVVARGGAAVATTSEAIVAMVRALALRAPRAETVSTPEVDLLEDVVNGLVRGEDVAP
jgi:hypothetical protein